MPAHLEVRVVPEAELVSGAVVTLAPQIPAHGTLLVAAGGGLPSIRMQEDFGSARAGRATGPRALAGRIPELPAAQLAAPERGAEAQGPAAEPGQDREAMPGDLAVAPLAAPASGGPPLVAAKVTRPHPAVGPPPHRGFAADVRRAQASDKDRWQSKPG